MKRWFAVAFLVLVLFSALGQVMSELAYNATLFASALVGLLLWRAAARRSNQKPPEWFNKELRVIMPQQPPVAPAAQEITWDHWDKPAIMRKRGWDKAQLFAWIAEQDETRPTLTLVPKPEQEIPDHLMVIPAT